MWYVVGVFAGKERKAIEGLGTLGIGVYYPCYTIKRTVRGKGIKQVRPMIPGYIFAETPEIEIAQRPILDIDGVYTILKGASGERPLAIPDFVIRHLREVEADKNRVKRFLPGDWVRVVDGLRSGAEAAILTIDNGGKIKLQEIGSVRPYTIKRTSVELVTTAATLGQPERSQPATS